MGHRRTAKTAAILAASLTARLGARGIILSAADRETLADVVLPLARGVDLAETLARKAAKFRGSVAEQADDVLDVVAEA